MQTIYTNLEKFESWVKETVKNYFDNIQDYLDELEESYMCNGTANYELKGFETKSGNPECYYYDVIDTFEDDDEENGEWISREFIF